MIWTSPPGKNEGYVLVDALAALFIVAILCAAVLAGTGVALKHAARQQDRVRVEIRERSTAVETAIRTGGF